MWNRFWCRKPNVSPLFCFQSSGIATELNALGATYTILVPVDSAFDTIDNSTMRFLTTTDEVWVNKGTKSELWG